MRPVDGETYARVNRQARHDAMLKYLHARYYVKVRRTTNGSKLWEVHCAQRSVLPVFGVVADTPLKAFEVAYKKARQLVPESATVSSSAGTN